MHVYTRVHKCIVCICVDVHVYYTYVYSIHVFIYKHVCIYSNPMRFRLLPLPFFQYTHEETESKKGYQPLSDVYKLQQREIPVFYKNIYSALFLMFPGQSSLYLQSQSSFPHLLRSLLQYDLTGRASRPPIKNRKTSPTSHPTQALTLFLVPLLIT